MYNPLEINKDLFYMTLSMSVDDKMALKVLAMKSGKTVSGMLHDWIEEHKE